MKVKTRALAILLSMVMVLTFMPALAFADDDENYYPWIEIYEQKDDTALFSDGNKNLIIEADDDGSGYDLQIKVGTNYDGDFIGWDAEFVEGEDYIYTESTGILKLYGANIYEKVKGTSDFIEVVAAYVNDNTCVEAWPYSVRVQEATEEYWFDFKYAEGYYDENLELEFFPGEKDLLYQQIDGYVANTKYPDGTDFSVNVSGASSSDTSVFTVTKKTVKNSKGKVTKTYWVLKGVKEGTAKLNIKFNGFSSDSVKVAIPVTVTKDKVYAYINSDSYYTGVPGDTLDFYANAWYESSDYDYDEDNLSYEWWIDADDGSADYASVVANEDDNSKATVSFTEGVDLKNYRDIMLWLKVSYTTRSGKTVSKTNRTSINLTTYTELLYPHSFEFDNLDIGHSYTFTPTVQISEYDNETHTAKKYEQEDVTFEVETNDSKVLKVKNNGDGSYTIKRLKGDEADLSIYTSWEKTDYYYYDDEEEAYTYDYVGPDNYYDFEEISTDLSDYHMEYTGIVDGDKFFIDPSNEGISPEMKVVDQYGHALPEDEYTLVIKKYNYNTDKYATSSCPLTFDTYEKNEYYDGTGLYLIYAKPSSTKRFSNNCEKSYIYVCNENSLSWICSNVELASRFDQYKNSNSEWESRYNLPLTDEAKLTSEDIIVTACYGDAAKEKQLTESADYTVRYVNNYTGDVLEEFPTTAGEYMLEIAGTGDYTGKQTQISLYVGKKNPIKVSKATKTVKLSKVKKKKQGVKPITVKGAVGTVRYYKMSGSGKLSVNKKTGKVIVKKGTKKGTYHAYVYITASGSDTYAPEEKIVYITVKVK